MDQTHETISALRAISVLRDASEHELGAAAASATELVLGVGERLAREGTTPTSIFVIIEGAAHAFVDGTLVATLGPGDVVADDHGAEPQPSRATVRAASTLRVLAVSPRSMRTQAVAP
jgi:CRP-like cAMP-binding protein